MIDLQTKGFELLSPTTKEEFQKIWDEYSKKIERKLKNAETCRIHIKEYSPGGKVKFSIHILVTYSGKNLEADASDWDLKKTCYKAFKKIEEQAEHMFHVSNQNKR